MSMPVGGLSPTSATQYWTVDSSRLHKTTDPEQITVDSRAREVIKAATGITLSPTGTMEVVDNPTGQMPPWDVINAINNKFTQAAKGSDVGPEEIAAEMAKYSDHFKPLASYNASALTGVWDVFKAKDATVDIRL